MLTYVLKKERVWVPIFILLYNRTSAACDPQCCPVIFLAVLFSVISTPPLPCPSVPSPIAALAAATLLQQPYRNPAGISSGFPSIAHCVPDKRRRKKNRNCSPLVQGRAKKTARENLKQALLQLGTRQNLHYNDASRRHQFSTMLFFFLWGTAQGSMEKTTGF